MKLESGDRSQGFLRRLWRQEETIDHTFASSLSMARQQRILDTSRAVSAEEQSSICPSSFLAAMCLRPIASSRSSKS